MIRINVCNRTVLQIVSLIVCFILAICTGSLASCAPEKKTASTEDKPQVEIPERQVAAPHDFKSEIIRLEELAGSGQLSNETKAELIKAHSGYVAEISMKRGVDPAEMVRVSYSHYMRILELDPGNPEAAAGLNSVSFWYEKRGQTLPAVFNPLDFLEEESDRSE